MIKFVNICTTKYAKPYALKPQINGTHTHTHTHTHMLKPVCEDGNVTVLCNQAVHTDREVIVNRPVIIIKTIKRKDTHW